MNIQRVSNAQIPLGMDPFCVPHGFQSYTAVPFLVNVNEIMWPDISTYTTDIRSKGALEQSYVNLLCVVVTVTPTLEHVSVFLVFLVLFNVFLHWSDLVAHLTPLTIKFH